MLGKNNQPLLGTLLKEADLISQQQLENALDIQSQYTAMKLGEILVLKSGIKAKTIDFFVNQWQNFVFLGKQFPIGHHLRNAALLNEQQIETILKEQNNSQEKFGVLAAQKGWVKQSTIDFLIKSLSQAPQLMSLITLEEYNDNVLHLEQKYANFSLILSRVLAWTGGNEILTKTICQTFASSDFNIAAGSEIKAVDRFVEKSLIRNWKTSEEAKYIRSIKTSLVNNLRYDPGLLLKEYQKTLLDEVEYQDTPLQNELVSLGLVVIHDNCLKVANIIYQQIFDQNFIVQELNQRQQQAKITKTNLAPQANKIAEYTAETSDIGTVNNSPNQITKPNQIKENLKENSPQPNTNTPEPLTKIASLITLVAIALLIPLFLLINNYYSSRLKSVQSETGEDSLINPEKLEQFCNELDLSDASASPKLIWQLEKNKQELTANNTSNSQMFPDSCEVALNRYRVLAAPQLGKESRVIEAIRNLCKVPADSEMYLDAEVWLKHWYNSNSWGEETKFYLEEFSEYNDTDCPAAHFIEYDN